MNLDERKYVLIAAVIFICIVFIFRLFWIQVVDTSWTARAADISARKITVFPSRGLIYDRHGELLVANTPVYDIMVVPREVKPRHVGVVNTAECTARQYGAVAHGARLFRLETQ